MSFAIYDMIKGQPDYGKQAENQEKARQAAIAQGSQAIDKAFAGFTPDFYKQNQQAYLNQALPQLAAQYNVTKDQIGFGLENKGIQKSGASQKAWSDLFRQEGLAKQGLVDSAIKSSQQLQTQVAGNKSQLLDQLYASADPAGAAANATSTAASLQVPATFAPIANQFSGLINQYYLSQILNPRTQSTVAAPTPQYGSTFAPIPDPMKSY